MYSNLIYSNRKFIMGLILILGLAMTAGCATKGQTGAVVGGAAGAAIGSTMGSWVVGGGVGAALGYIIGNEWDKYDESQAAQAVYTDQPTTWTNNTNGTRYTAIPGETYVRNGVRYKTVTIVDANGVERQVTMRQNSQGNWETIN